MQAQDIMTRDVVTVEPSTPVHQIATLMTGRRISGMPVVSASGAVVGIVSESDLMHRIETGTQRESKWWLSLFSDPDQMARDYAKTRGLKAEDVMSRNVVSVEFDTPLRKVAEMLDSNRVKRLPVMQGDRLVGLITRSDLVKALLASTSATAEPGAAVSDAAIHTEITKRMNEVTWLDRMFINTVVNDGVVKFHGFIGSNDQRRALHVLAEEVPGVRAVQDELVLGLPTARAM